MKFLENILIIPKEKNKKLQKNQKNIQLQYEEQEQNIDLYGIPLIFGKIFFNNTDIIQLIQENNLMPLPILLEQEYKNKLDQLQCNQVIFQGQIMDIIFDQFNNEEFYFVIYSEEKNISFLSQIAILDFILTGQSVNKKIFRALYNQFIHIKARISIYELIELNNQTAIAKLKIEDNFESPIYQEIFKLLQKGLCQLSQITYFIIPNQAELKELCSLYENSKKQSIGIYYNTISINFNDINPFSQFLQCFICEVVDVENYKIIHLDKQYHYKLAFIKGPQKQSDVYLEAKEFARSNFIGQNVLVKVIETSSNNEQIANIMLQKNNTSISEILIKNGFAYQSLENFKEESQNLFINEDIALLQSFEKEAKQQLRGMHQKVQAKTQLASRYSNGNTKIQDIFQNNKLFEFGKTKSLVVIVEEIKNCCEYKQFEIILNGIVPSFIINGQDPLIEKLQQKSYFLAYAKLNQREVINIYKIQIIFARCYLNLFILIKMTKLEEILYMGKKRLIFQKNYYKKDMLYYLQKNKILILISKTYFMIKTTQKLNKKPKKIKNQIKQIHKGIWAINQTLIVDAVKKNQSPQKTYSNSYQKGDILEGKITYVISPTEFYFQSIALMEQINYIIKCNTDSQKFEDQIQIQEDQFYLGKSYEDEKFHRVLAEKVHKNYITLYFIDYGNREKINSTKNEIIKQPQELYQYPPQAIRCKFEKIQSPLNTFNDINIDEVRNQALDYLQDLIFDKNLELTIVQKHNQNYIVSVNLQNQSIEKLLLENGYAIISSQVPKQDELEQLQSKAILQKLGYWGTQEQYTIDELLNQDETQFQNKYDSKYDQMYL